MTIAPIKPNTKERDGLPGDAFALTTERKYLILTPEHAAITKARAIIHRDEKRIPDKRYRYIIARAETAIWDSEDGAIEPHLAEPPSPITVLDQLEARCAANAVLFAIAANDAATPFDRDALNKESLEARQILISRYGEALALKIIKAASRAVAGFRDTEAARGAAVARIAGKRIADLAI